MMVRGPHDFTTRGPHDIGGLPAGPVDPSHHPEADWELLATAVSGAIGPNGAGLICVHERRRMTEDLGEDYNRLAYFERAIVATARLMVEKGVLTEDEIAGRMADIAARQGNNA
jgi:hypothetical protein